MSRRVHRSRVTHDRWLVSYADFITLLFGFFVVLYAFSKADQKKQTQVTASIDTAFRSMALFHDAAGHVHGSVVPAAENDKAAAMNVVMSEQVRSPARVKTDLDQLGRELTQTLSKELAERTVSIRLGRDGLVISLREAGFFASGSATPRPESLPTLREIAASLSKTAYDMRVEGHTDNIAIHTAEFDSNWELSTSRATRVARMLLDLRAMPPERVSVAGYAEYHPEASNESEEGRAENRRVDLVVLPRTTIDLSEPDLSHGSGSWRRITDDH
jgi:chemotaxis protein MotB